MKNSSKACSIRQTGACFLGKSASELVMIVVKAWRMWIKSRDSFEDAVKMLDLHLLQRRMMEKHNHTFTIHFPLSGGASLWTLPLPHCIIGNSYLGKVHVRILASVRLYSVCKAKATGRARSPNTSAPLFVCFALLSTRVGDYPQLNKHNNLIMTYDWLITCPLCGRLSQWGQFAQ